MNKQLNASLTQQTEDVKVKTQLFTKKVANQALWLIKADTTLNTLFDSQHCKRYRRK